MRDEERLRLLRENVHDIYPERIAFFQRWADIYGGLLRGLCAMLGAQIVLAVVGAPTALVAGLAILGTLAVIVAQVWERLESRRVRKPHDV
jgi:hypothetical protein